MPLLTRATRPFFRLSRLLVSVFAWSMISTGISAAPDAAQSRNVELPRIYSLSAASLVEARKQVRESSSALAPALAQLLSEADEALRQKPVSVMDKTSVSASGDKHDYYSMGPYWWPDPAKPDGLPYIWRDGFSNPESAKGTDHKALGQTCRNIWTLALAYYLTDRPAYAEQAALLARVWFLDPATRMNPNLQYGQAIPGSHEGRPTGIIETGLLINVTDGLSLLDSSPAWTASDRNAFNTWIKTYLDWLLASSHGRIEHDQQNNHGTWYDAQVVQFSLFLGRDSFARDYLIGARSRRLDEHIAADGSQPSEMTRTASLPYSVFNLRGLVTLAQQAGHVGLDWWIDDAKHDDALRRAVVYLAPYMDPSTPWIKGAPKTWGNRRELRELLVLAGPPLSAAEATALRALMAKEPFNKERARLFLLPPSP